MSRRADPPLQLLVPPHTPRAPFGAQLGYARRTLQPRPNHHPNGLLERWIGELRRLRCRAPPRASDSAAAPAPNVSWPHDLDRTVQNTQARVNRGDTGQRLAFLQKRPRVSLESTRGPFQF